MLSKTKVTGEKMTNERIKEILLDIEETGIDFSVIQTGKESKEDTNDSKQRKQNNGF